MRQSNLFIPICISNAWKNSCIIIVYLHIYRLIINPHNNLLPVGLVAQLVEHCTCIAEVNIQIPLRPEFSDLSCRCLSSTKMRWSNSFIFFLLLQLHNKGLKFGMYAGAVYFELLNADYVRSSTCYCIIAQQVFHWIVQMSGLSPGFDISASPVAWG